MWMRRCLLVTLGMAALAGCTNGSGYSGIGSESGFYADDWIYYNDGDEYFLAGLTDEEKEALKRDWDSLSPEERQQIRAMARIGTKTSHRRADRAASWVSR
jgi:hypothetical protein